LTKEGIRCKSFLQWYVDTIIDFLDIFYCPVLNNNNNNNNSNNKPGQWIMSKEGDQSSIF
jgi:hypothetical protein